MNYFQGNKSHPKHLSVGVVLLNKKGEVCCHHFTRGDIEGYWPDLGINDFYILMRKTVEPDQSLESAIRKGLMEEFGAEAEIDDYIGTLVSNFEDRGVLIEKSTIYFKCQLTSQDLGKRDRGDIEGQSEVEWRTADFLIPKMKAQAIKYNRTDIDESVILEKLKDLL